MIREFLIYFLILANTIYAGKARLIVFGDEFSDIGNETPYFPKVSTWYRRLSNGPVWNEYTTYFNDYILMNYATYGAVANKSHILNHGGDVREVSDLANQVKKFTQSYPQYSKNSDIKKDVVAIHIGTNDLLRLGGSPDARALQKGSCIIFVNSIMQQVEKLYNFGFRNFVVMDLFRVQDTPLKSEFNSEKLNLMGSFAQQGTEILEKGVKKFERSKSNSGPVVKVASIQMFYKSIVLSDVARHTGCTDTTSSCHPYSSKDVFPASCIDPNKNIFYYGPLLSTKPHALLGAYVADLLRQGDVRISKKYLSQLARKHRISEIGMKNNFLFAENGTFSDKLRITEYTSNKKANLSENAK